MPHVNYHKRKLTRSKRLYSSCCSNHGIEISIIPNWASKIAVWKSNNLNLKVYLRIFDKSLFRLTSQIIQIQNIMTFASDHQASFGQKFTVGDLGSIVKYFAGKHLASICQKFVAIDSGFVDKIILQFSVKKGSEGHLRGLKQFSGKHHIRTNSQKSPPSPICIFNFVVCFRNLRVSSWGLELARGQFEGLETFKIKSASLSSIWRTICQVFWRVYPGGAEFRRKINDQLW